MNQLQANNLSIIGYLASINIFPELVINEFAWYYSPFENQEKLNFKVDRNKNTWFDYRSGTSGNLLSLVMKLNKTGIVGALLLLQYPELLTTIKKINNTRQTKRHPVNTECPAVALVAID